VDNASPVVDPPSPLRLPLTVVLALIAPPLALLAWIFLSGARKATYFRSPWIRLGLGILVVGAFPLLAVITAAAVGLWPDPNPNPVGLGLLFFAAGVVACLLTLIGILRVARTPATA